MIDTLRLTAEDAAALLEREELTAAELHAAYLEATAARDGELHAYLTTVDEPSGDGGVVDGDVVVEEPRAGRGADALRADEVLERDRDAVV